MKAYIKYIAAIICIVLCHSVKLSAQFKEEAFQQTYVDENDSTAYKDSTDKLFSFKELFGGLAHKNSVKIGTMFFGSAILPGTAQIYNKDYWKLPIVYGGIASFAGTGGYYLHRYNKSKKAYATWENNMNLFIEANPGLQYDVPQPMIDYKSKTTGTWLMIGAGLVYWGSMLDGVICFEKDKHPHPGRATIYSALLPGLGQAYNGEYWKVPVYYAGLMAAGFSLHTNNVNYQRFKRIHNQATTPGSGYTGSVSAETAKYYRDTYRRYRDYSIVATVAVYLLQVIDANVFAFMHDFEVSDDLAIDLGPSVIPVDNAYAFCPTQSMFGQSALGVSLGLKF